METPPNTGATPKTASASDVLHLLGDLNCKFSGGNKNQSRGSGRAGLESFGDRNGECERFARARSGLSQHVSALECVAHHEGLDFEWGVNAPAGQRLVNGRGNAEFGER